MVFELCGALLAGAAIAVALVAWRLSAGPIEVEFLTPYLEEALSDPAGQQVEIARTVIVWQGWSGNPELRAEGVVARGTEGQVVASVPAVALSISLESLLQGVVAPTRVELVEPRLHLLRDADGSVRLDIAGDDDRPGDPSVVDGLLRELMAPPHRQGPLGQLRRLSVRDAVIVVDDRKLGRTWRLPDGDFVFRRGDRGLDGTLSIEIDLGARRQRLDGTFVHRLDGGRTEMKLAFDVPDPRELAALAPELAQLAALGLPVKGEATLEVAFPDRADVGSPMVRAATFALRADGGWISHPALPGGAVAVSAGTAGLRWDVAGGRILVDDLFLDLGGPSIAVSGQVEGIGADIFARLREGRQPAIRVAMETAIVDLPTPTLWQLWPQSLVPGGRRWVVANIADGRVRDAQIRVAATLPAGGGEARVDKLDGVFSYEGLTVTYMPGLPSVRQVHGVARFDDQQLVLDVAGGTLLRQTRVDRTTVRVVDFQKREQQILIEAGTAGPAREALEVIDRPRLGFLARFGLRPADVSGDSTVRMSFAFPAIESLRMDDVRLKITAQVKKGALPAGVRDWRLTDAELAFEVDKDKLEASGTGMLLGVPVTITGREIFAANAPIGSEYTLKGRMDEAARQRFGYDYPPWLRGPADVDLLYRSRLQRRSELLLKADLKPATLTIAEAGWSKPPGVAAQAELAFDFVAGDLQHIRKLHLEAPGLSFDGAIDYTGPDWVLDVQQGILGRTRLAGRVRPRGQGYAADMRGPVLDAVPLLEADGASAAGGARKPLHVTGRFDRVLLGEGRDLTGVAGAIDIDAAGRKRGQLNGRLARGGAIAAAITPLGDGRDRLVAETDDFGTILSAFAGRNTFRGGTLRVEGVIAGTGLAQTVTGTVRGADYRLVKAPAAAKLFSVLSLSSMASLLQGDGLPFADLRFDYVLKGGVLTLRQGRAYGGAIGGTFEGVVDTNASTLDIEGTLVPAYTLNNLLGNIPILGTLLAGGKDEGVFAANFRMAGPFDDPGISVNPLSALAPGILRKLFPFLEAGDPRSSSGGGVAPDFRQDGVKPPP
ncbi:hypothetical protein STHU_39960 [Allostella humosa]|uniref:YhdP family protein n=1 Tax=Stella humosa TaxID=94 RepID=UPI000F4B071E|nr:DUF3971 domain-containing protein [Stella humosa]BBK33362.1 hypothetical protein STHU_39960 [Stella humosa]